MENMKTIKKREVSIDLLESIAMFLVILYHSTLYSYDIVNESSSLYYVRYLFRTLLSPCVPLFFFANGYLLFNRKFNLKKHIMKIIKLIILCGVWEIIQMILLMLIKNEFLTAIEFIKALWTFRIGWVNSLWFIGALVCIYLIFPLLKIAYDNYKTIFFYFIIISAILTFGNTILNEGATIFLTQILHKNVTLQQFNFFNIFNPFRGIYGYAFVYFMVGGYVYQIKDKILSINATKRNVSAICVMLINCILLWGVGICYSKADNAIWDVVWNGYDTVFTLLNVICIFILCLNLSKDYLFFRTISCNTLGIYFTHYIFIKLTINPIKKYSFILNIPFNILYAFIILLIGLSVVILMKKVPFLKKLVS